jgi:hypothetical protein
MRASHESVRSSRPRRTSERRPPADASCSQQPARGSWGQGRSRAVDRQPSVLQHRPAFTLVLYSAYSTPWMEAICSSEMSVDFQRTILYSHRCKDRKSYINDKKFWEELITYCLLTRHGLHRKRRLQFFVAEGTSLPSRCLATIRQYTSRQTDGRDL